MVPVPSSHPRDDPIRTDDPPEPEPCMMPHLVRQLRRFSMVGTLLLGTSACRAEPSALPDWSGSCGASGSPALEVTVRDSLTGAYAATNATFTATIGLVVESKTRPPGPGSDSLPMILGDQPGTYRLEVRKPGYLAWRRDSVVVPVDPRVACNRSLRQLVTVQLVPGG